MFFNEDRKTYFNRPVSVNNRVIDLIHVEVHLSCFIYNVNETGLFNFDNVSVLDYCQSVKIQLQLEFINSELQYNSINRSLIMNSIYHSDINRNGNG